MLQSHDKHRKYLFFFPRFLEQEKTKLGDGCIFQTAFQWCHIHPGICHGSQNPQKRKGWYSSLHSYEGIEPLDNNFCKAWVILYNYSVINTRIFCTLNAVESCGCLSGFGKQEDTKCRWGRCSDHHARDSSKKLQPRSKGCNTATTDAQ